MNWRIGESMPGMAISAIWAAFSRAYSVGLNWTSNRFGSPRGSSTASSSTSSRPTFEALMAELDCLDRHCALARVEFGTHPLAGKRSAEVPLHEDLLAVRPAHGHRAALPVNRSGQEGLVPVPHRPV